MEGKLIIFGVLGFLGIALWLVWNQLIFGNFLYFANSDYGSKAQQMWFYARGYLPTYKNLPLSVLYYLTDTYLVLGVTISVLAMLGFALYLGKNLINWIKLKNTQSFALMLLLTPIVFYSISLYIGQASLILPPFAKPWYEWTMSNVRYGVQMLIPASIFSAYLVSKVKFSTILVSLLIIIQFGLFIQNGNVIVYQDGTSGLSSQKISKGPDAYPVEEWMNRHYDSGLVLMDDYRRPISPVSSGVPMRNFISVGNKPYWQESLDNPTKYAEWVILQKADTDSVWTGLKNKQILDDYYLSVYRTGNIWVYKKRDMNEKFVGRQGQNFILHGQKLALKGVNIYDFLQFSYSDIDDTLSNLKNNGINTVRMWGFNKEALLNQNDYLKLDYILQESSKRGIYLIIVFGNQWGDYGGVNAFTSYGSKDFYTNEDSLKLYKNHIDEILTHKNSLTETFYKNDPTILGWEILNEPRMEYDFDNEIVSLWVEKVGQNIATIDNNHLISVGVEGFLGGEGDRPYHESHGSNLQSICSLAVIDMCSVHLYPKYLEKGSMSNQIEQLLSEWQNEANKVHKPLYIGEVGFDLDAASQNRKYEERKDFFTDVFVISERKRINGVIIWNLTLEHNNFYSLSFDNKEDQKIFKTWNQVKAGQL
jgi:mannan endo-1,4-beta-mannosidase